MAVGSGTAALISGAGSLLGQFTESRSSEKQMNRTIRANRALADLEWFRNQEMWSMQNEYNKPSAQMARLKEAGLNPNLMYGQGTTGNAEQAPHYKRPQEDHSFDYMRIAPVISQFQDTMVKKAQIDNLEAQNQKIIQSTITDVMRAAGIGVSTAKTQFDLNLAKKLEENSLSAAQENLRKIRADIAHTYSATSESGLRQEGLRLENDLNAALKPMGITSKDSALLRIMLRLLGRGPGSEGIPEYMVPKFNMPKF